MVFGLNCVAGWVRRLLVPVWPVRLNPRFGGLRWWFVCPLLVGDHSCDRVFRNSEVAETALREAAAGTDSEEIRSRTATLLKALDPTTLTGDRLRAIRAVKALE